MSTFQTFLENIHRMFLALTTENGQPVTEARFNAVLGTLSKATTHTKQQMPEPGSGTWNEAEADDEGQPLAGATPAAPAGHHSKDDGMADTKSPSSKPVNNSVPTGAVPPGSTFLTFPKVPSTGEFPDGDVHYCVPLNKDEARSTVGQHLGRAVGWATLVYGRNHLVDGSISYFKACLGVYMCPIPDCQYTERPRVPRAERCKDASPMPAKTICKMHHEPLIHIACSATIRMVQRDSSVDVYHKGWHQHP
jgi:hypothetical protein